MISLHIRLEIILLVRIGWMTEINLLRKVLLYIILSGKDAGHSLQKASLINQVSKGNPFLNQNVPQRDIKIWSQTGFMTNWVPQRCI